MIVGVVLAVIILAGILTYNIRNLFIESPETFKIVEASDLSSLGATNETPFVFEKKVFLGVDKPRMFLMEFFNKNDVKEQIILENVSCVDASSRLPIDYVVFELPSDDIVPANEAKIIGVTVFISSPEEMVADTSALCEVKVSLGADSYSGAMLVDIQK